MYNIYFIHFFSLLRHWAYICAGDVIEEEGGEKEKLKKEEIEMRIKEEKRQCEGKM
jgi:hypothetical protein